MLRRTKILRKLTTRPILWYERNRPYLLKTRWLDLPTIHTQNHSRQIIIILTTAAGFDQAIWAAWSWAQYLSESFQFNIAVDGSISEKQVARARVCLPNIQIKSINHFIGGFAERSPLLARFKQNHILGPKFCLIAAQQEMQHVLYVDSDVLLLNKPNDLMLQIDGLHNCYNQESDVPSYDDSILFSASLTGHKPCEKLNSGLLFMRAGSLDINLAIDILDNWNPSSNSWFSEQTLISLLMEHAGSNPLCNKLYIVNNSRQFWWDNDIDYGSIHARHFTGTTRHLMYLKGYPYLLRKAEKYSSSS